MFFLVSVVPLTCFSQQSGGGSSRRPGLDSMDLLSMARADRAGAPALFVDTETFKVLQPLVTLSQTLETEYREMFLLCQRAKPGDILTTKGIKQSPAVAEHVKLDLISGDSDTDYYRVQRISDSYKKLLEQQVQQLVSMA